jgi:hypothetical protein
VDIVRTSPVTTSEEKTFSKKKLHVGVAKAVTTDLNSLALRVLKDRIGLDAKMAHAFVNTHGARVAMCCAHCFLVGKPNAGAGLFVRMMQYLEEFVPKPNRRHAFTYRKSTDEQISPTESGGDLQSLFDDGTKAFRRQVTEDFQRLADGGELRTSPSPQYVRSELKRPRTLHDYSYSSTS